MVKTEEKLHPLYTELEDEDLISELHSKLAFMEKFLGVRRLKKLLKIGGRNYHCPHCTDRNGREWTNGTVYLIPNTPESTNSTCLICDRNYFIKRKSCPNHSCKGNVIWVNEEDENEILCLTCNEMIDPDDIKIKDTNSRGGPREDYIG